MLVELRRRKISKKRPYKRYTDKFKRDAMRVVEEEGLSVARVARDLGVNANSIHNWLKKHRDPGAGKLDRD